MKKKMCARKECPQKVRGWKGEKCGGKYGFPQELRPEKSCAKELLGIFFGYFLPSASTNVWTWGSIYGCSFNVHYPKSEYVVKESTK